MINPNFEKLASLLINHSCSLKKDEKILIEGFDVPQEMVIALIRAARNVGGLPFVTWKNNLILKELISERLFGNLLSGWVEFSPIQASVRSKLFDSGCIIEEKIDANGKYQSLVSISQSMINEFEGLEIFNDLRPVSP